MSIKNLTDEELEQKIKVASAAYGNADPIMSDYDFDQLINEKKRRNPSYEDDVTYDEGDLEGFTKMTHTMTTGTLSKCKNEEEFREWFKKHPGKYSVETKLDGAGVELIYDKGILQHAITRGDGYEGYDIKANILKFVPSKIDSSFTGSIRGEYLISKETFNNFFKDKFANCRNGAAGLVKRLDGKDCEKLDFVAYDILADGFNNQIQTLHFLKTNGFDTPANIISDNIDIILDWRKTISESRNVIPYDIDGIVVKPVELNIEDRQLKTPKNSCAIKFDLAEEVSEIIDIEWNMTGSIVAPVAIIKPVQLCGTTVKRASISNIRWMIENNIEIGKKCVIVKSGEIIPQIDRVI